jgi:hypothetical protein
MENAAIPAANSETTRQRIILNSLNQTPRHYRKWRGPARGQAHGQ